MLEDLSYRCEEASTLSFVEAIARDKLTPRSHIHGHVLQCLTRCCTTSCATFTHFTSLLTRFCKIFEPQLDLRGPRYRRPRDKS